MSVETRIAKTPFELYTLAHVTRRRGQTASTPRELLASLATCSDESIYHHVIVAMRSQLGVTGRVLNDFAQRALSAFCGGQKQTRTAEQRLFGVA
jgi:hypothetical protein